MSGSIPPGGNQEEIKMKFFLKLNAFLVVAICVGYAVKDAINSNSDMLTLLAPLVLINLCVGAWFYLKGKFS